MAQFRATRGYMPDLKSLRGVSEQDRRMIADAEALLGPEPSKMGWVKNLFWGRMREELIFPYPIVAEEENARCEMLLAKLDHYLRTEHPAVEIDQNEQIPRWVIDRLFELGVLGMTIPREFGGGGLGITSYNRVLERIGRYCGSTAVLVSAHQSIGCKAIMLFGTEEQKNAGCRRSPVNHSARFVFPNPTSAATPADRKRAARSAKTARITFSTAKRNGRPAGHGRICSRSCASRMMADGKEKVTALVCTPDMPGMEIFQNNRSKCGIRGTWQARIRFHDVNVPREHLLHQEGKGLNVALYMPGLRPMHFIRRHARRRDARV